MLRHITFTVFITTSMNTLATGMVPETSVLLVDEKRGEASINIKNTDDHPSLLYTTIVDLPESNKSIRLIPTQPVIRVEAGSSTTGSIFTSGDCSSAIRRAETRNVRRYSTKR
ncbi:putative periplasmic chaperone protein [Escherichia coli]|uniref:Putative periplasmic chaperone protein n=1 Tax=Escherichia coli TaxID=562 RepID=A0A377DKR3_ECOLX|nr:putative periplasmic chaperone protein [Escherichia coli]